MTAFFDKGILRVAVIDGYSSGRHLAKQLANSGVACVHVRSKSWLPEYLEHSFDPADYEFDLGYQPDLAAVVARLGGLGIRQVVPGTETGVLLADAIAAELGLPGNDLATGPARRSKFAMAQLLAESGLNAPRSALVGDAGEAVAWFRASGLASVVLKPVDSAASDRVFFCDTEAQVRAAASEILSSDNVFGDTNRAAVIQEALAGPELYVNTVSIDGVHHIVETWQYRKGRTADGMPMFDFEEPADLGAPATQAVHAYVGRALTALGIRTGAAHSEVVLTERGPVLIDPGARLGGGVLPWVAEKIIGYSHASVYADSVADPAAVSARAAEFPRPWPQPIRYVSLINRHPGVAAELDWVNRLEDLPSCIAVSTGLSPGTALAQTSTLLSSPGFVYLSADSQQAVEADYHRIRRWEDAGLYTAGKPAGARLVSAGAPVAAAGGNVVGDD